MHNLACFSPINPYFTAYSGFERVSAFLAFNIPRPLRYCLPAVGLHLGDAEVGYSVSRFVSLPGTSPERLNLGVDPAMPLLR